MNIGEKFTVTEPQAIRNEKGRRLANFLPGFDYPVTARNREFVAGLIASGKATPGSIAGAATAKRMEKREADREAIRARRREERAARRGSGVNVEAKAPRGKLRGVINTGPAKD